MRWLRVLRPSLIVILIISWLGLPQVFGHDFVSQNTSALMSSPYGFPDYVHEPAFPHLTFSKPVRITTAGKLKGRLFVATQEGLLYSFRNDPETADSQVVLDLGKSVAPAGGDNGLLDVAFHPQFPDRRELYAVYISRTRPKATVVSRFQITGRSFQVDRNSEEILIKIDQPFNDHNAACLQFGPDGYLYISLGDGGWDLENYNAQNMETLLGSMLRIDVSNRTTNLPYAIPADNPFIGISKARSEIWATGLRAPWRFSFDIVTGQCWLGDNGQNAREEINLIRPGGNYGWPRYEGIIPFDPATVVIRGKPVLNPDAGPRTIDAKTTNSLIPPVIDYDHKRGRSVVGGLVYRGNRYPALKGCYIYGDYGNGNIWALRIKNGEVIENRLIARTVLKITSFAVDELGNLYFTAFDNRIHRLRRDIEKPPNRIPFPRLLSETGLFESVSELKPGPGLIPYQVNVPLWSDGAAKERYMALPAAGQVVLRKNGAWEFPLGTVFVKSFFLPAGIDSKKGNRIETRLFLKNRRGWAGYTYLWNDDQTEARLLDGAAVRNYPVKSENKISQRDWHVPSRSDCMACHSKEAGFVLGMRTAQVNRDDRDGINQLRKWKELGTFSDPVPELGDSLPSFPDWDSGEGDLQQRARAYLHVNCAGCHTPPGFTKLDLRFGIPPRQMQIINQQPEKVRLSPGESMIVTPGHPQLSELILRMSRRGPGQMPPLATTQTDPRGIAAIRNWIRSMPASPEK